jgi:hypothetical protein
MLQVWSAHGWTELRVSQSALHLRAGLGTLTRWNKIANGALRDVADRYYEGVLYSENSTQFHSTHLNVIPFQPYKKHDFLYAHYRQTDRRTIIALYVTTNSRNSFAL